MLNANDCVLVTGGAGFILGDLLWWNRVKLDEYDTVFHLAANAYIPPSNVAPGMTYTIADLVAKLSEVCCLAPKVNYGGQGRPGDAEK